MNADHAEVHLSKRELMFQRNTSFLPPGLVDLIEGSRRISDDKHALSVSRIVAEEFRDAFTERLARAGFDRDYEPTSEGRMLEDLIDRFYMP